MLPPRLVHNENNTRITFAIAISPHQRVRHRLRGLRSSIRNILNKRSCMAQRYNWTWPPFVVVVVALFHGTAASKTICSHAPDSLEAQPGTLTCVPQWSSSGRIIYIPYRTLRAPLPVLAHDTWVTSKREMRKQRRGQDGYGKRRII